MRLTNIEHLEPALEGGMALTLGGEFHKDVEGQRARLVLYRLFGQTSLLIVFEAPNGDELDTIKVKLEGDSLAAFDTVSPGSHLVIRDSDQNQVFIQQPADAITIGQMTGVLT